MKKTIIGKELVSSTGSGWSQHIDLMGRYWPPDKIHCQASHSIDCIPAQGNSVYMSDSCYYTKFPIPVARIKVTLPGPYSYRYRSRSKINYIDASREQAIGFRPEWSKYYQAYYFLTTKTLLLHNNTSLAIDYIIAILDYLETNGHITRLPTEANVGEQSMFIVEIHDGSPEIVSCPIRSKNVTVGTDPEFEIIRDGQVIRPPSYYNGTRTRIGLDGAGCQIELRPKAGTPEEVVDDMKTLFREIKDPVTVLGNVYPLGGHIHLGVGNQATPTPDLLWLLDYFLGTPTINLSGTARSSYRKMSAYESKPWGFEYRTPPAAIFWNPEFARLSMKICQEVTACYINKQTIRVTSPAPVKEDYLNYCGFTEEEYDHWIRQIQSYNDFQCHYESLKINIASFWDSSIPANTQIRSACSDATWSSNRCENPECMTCYPTTAPAARELRLRNQYASNTNEDAETERRLTASEAARAQQQQAINSRVAMESHRSIMNDDWSVASLQLIDRVLREHEYEPVDNVCLFGLSQSRGTVINGFTMDGIGQAQGMTPVPHRYGIPWVCRMTDTEDDLLESMIRRIIEIERQFVPAPEPMSIPAESIFDNSLPDRLFQVGNSVALARDSNCKRTRGIHR